MTYVKNNPLRYTDPTGHEDADNEGALGGPNTGGDNEGPGDVSNTNDSNAKSNDDSKEQEVKAETEKSKPLINEIVDKVLDGLSRLTGIPRHGTYYAGFGVLGFIANTPISSRGKGTVGSIAIAINLKTGEKAVIVTTGGTKQGSLVKGAALGMGFIFGGVEGEMADLLGKAETLSRSALAFTKSDIETETGKKGVEYGMGKSIGLGGVVVDTFTEPLVKW